VNNTINRYLTSISSSLLAGGAAYTVAGKGQESEAWLFRDDIGAPHGIKGYEEQVNSVGLHHGHNHFPSDVHWDTWNSATLRRGFKVFSRACQGCHGAMHQKYDLLVDKGFKQKELKAKMVYLPKVHPAHQKYRSDFFQEWDYRQRTISDRIWPPYMTVHQAKSANQGVWPPELSKAATHQPGHVNYPYNLLTGYHYGAPFGLDVPEGRYFNPYYDHMIIAMPPQLHDGMIEYEDGTPASAPQMAHDVAEYISFLGKNKQPDQKVVVSMMLAVVATFYPISYMFTKYHYVNTYSYRLEVYAVKSGGYKKFREKMFKTNKTQGNWLGNYS
jgi:ubiquinol-cytochrome c reductase cytochrome c1 subunit